MCSIGCRFIGKHYPVAQRFWRPPIVSQLCRYQNQEKSRWQASDSDQTSGKEVYIPGLCCSKLTMSLVNDSLKFTSSDTQIR